MTKIEITEARRKKIETLIKAARRMANVSRSSCNVSAARLLEGLADVAVEYVRGMK